MKNLTIAQKLYALVSISLFSLVLTAVLANMELSQSQERFDIVQKRVIPSILLLDDTNSKTAALRSAVRDYVISGFMNDLTLKETQKKLSDC